MCHWKIITNLLYRTFTEKRPYFWIYPSFYITQCIKMEADGSFYAKNQLNQLSHFDTILACDRQIHRH